MKVNIGVLTKSNTSTHGLVFHTSCFKEIAGEEYTEALKEIVLVDAFKPAAKARAAKTVKVPRVNVRKLVRRIKAKKHPHWPKNS